MAIYPASSVNEEFPVGYRMNKKNITIQAFPLECYCDREQNNHMFRMFFVLFCKTLPVPMK